jgi:putative ABC transport system permease protein
MASVQWRVELRNFRKYLGSNLLIVALLGVGLAATIVIFSFLKALVLVPAPFPNASNIHQIGLISKENGDQLEDASGALIAQWQADFAANYSSPVWFGVAPGTINIGGAEQLTPERVDGAFVLGPIWTLLGVTPLMGRDFSADDFKSGAAPVAILGSSLWRSRYLSNPNIIGSSIRINGKPATVIAVMPERISFPRRETLWTQADISATGPQLDYGFGVFLSAKNADEKGRGLALMQNQFLIWQQQSTDRMDYLQVGDRRLQDWMVAWEMKLVTGVMFGAVCLLLFAVCLNAASVLLVRLFSERSENAVRLALGSGWAPLAMSTLVQCLMLAGLAALLANQLSWMAGHAIMDMFTGSDEGFPMWVDFESAVGPWHVFAFALLGALLTAVLPMWRLRQQSLSGAMRQSGRAVTSAQIGARVLVFVQVCLSCVVVACASAVVAQVRATVIAPVGVEGQKVLTARVGLFQQSYPKMQDIDQFREQLITRLQQSSEVEHASLATALPADNSDSELVQFGPLANEQSRPINVAYVDENFLATYGIKLLAGRNLTAQEIMRPAAIEGAAETAVVSKPCTTVIDARFAQLLGGNSAALGQPVRVDPKATDSTNCEVVGVVNALELDELDGDLNYAMLVPLSQEQARFMTVAVKVKSNPQAFKPALVRTVSALNPDQPVYWLRTFEEVRAATSVGNRVLSILFSGLSIIALALSAAGLYGLLSFQAEQRKTEVGLRLALGASTWQVMHALFARSLLMVFAGVVIGSILASYPAGALTPLISQQDIGWSASFTMPLLFALAALLASIKPALRALRVQPQQALRGDS